LTVTAEQIRKLFEDEFHIPVYVHLSFFTRHPGLVFLALTAGMIAVPLAFVWVLMTFRAVGEFFSRMSVATGMALLWAVIIAIIALAVAFGKGMILHVARFAPEAAVALLRPVKDDIIEIRVENRRTSVRLSRAETPGLDVACVYQGTYAQMVRFYLDLQLYMPIDKTKVEEATRRLSGKGWKAFGMQTRHGGKRLEYFGTFGVGQNYSPDQVLPELLALVRG